jgi:hypothetical protein
MTVNAKISAGCFALLEVVNKEQQTKKKGCHGNQDYKVIHQIVKLSFERNEICVQKKTSKQQNNSSYNDQHIIQENVKN